MTTTREDRVLKTFTAALRAELEHRASGNPPTRAGSTRGFSVKLRGGNIVRRGNKEIAAVNKLMLDAANVLLSRDGGGGCKGAALTDLLSFLQCKSDNCTCQSSQSRRGNSSRPYRSGKSVPASSGAIRPGGLVQGTRNRVLEALNDLDREGYFERQPDLDPVCYIDATLAETMTTDELLQHAFCN